MLRKALPEGNPIAVYDLEGGYTTRLPDSIRKNLSAMGRLNHRVVDIIADYELFDGLVGNVQMRPMTLADDILLEFLLHLVKEPKAGKKRRECAKT